MIWLGLGTKMWIRLGEDQGKYFLDVRGPLCHDNKHGVKGHQY